MDPSYKFLLAVALLSSIGACQTTRSAERFPGFASPSSAVYYAEKFGCDTAEMRREATENKNKPVAIGESTCVLLGRFGKPDRQIVSKGDGSEIVSYIWAIGHGTYSATSYFYDDTEGNRMVGVRVGRWYVGDTQSAGR